MFINRFNLLVSPELLYFALLHCINVHFLISAEHAIITTSISHLTKSSHK